MKISFAGTMTAIVAAAAVLAAGAASAKPELVMLKGTMVNGKMISKRIEPAKTLAPTVHSYTYSFSADVPKRTKTIITGWALIDQSTCTEITAGKMKEEGAKKDSNGKWSTGLYTEAGYTCANGGTITATFGSVFYSWTNVHAKKGTTDKGVALWVGKGGGSIGTYKITNNDTAIYVK